MSMISNTVKKMLYYGGYYTLKYAICGKKRSDTYLVLMYHDIVSRQESNRDGTCSRLWFHPTVGQFEDQLRVLKQEFKICSLEQIIENIRETGRFSGPCAAITFDDGYESFYKLAYPLLCRHKLPATVFLVPDWINGKMLPWWERFFNLASLFAGSGCLGQTFGEIMRNECGESSLNSHWETLYFPRLLDYWEEYLKSIETEKREMIIKKLERQAPGFCGYDTIPRPMTWDQAAEISQNGIRLGSHSMSHLNMNQESFQKFEQEARESKREIELKTGAVVDGFAFPYGIVGKEPAQTTAMLRNTGYRYACTTIPQSNQFDSDHYGISRITLPFTDSRALIHREMILGFLA